jgi:hypothetical protein
MAAILNFRSANDSQVYYRTTQWSFQQSHNSIGLVVKLAITVHWMVLYQICVFGVDRKFSMAITCSDWLKFQKSSCQKPPSQLNCDFAGMIIGWSCNKLVNRLPIGNSRWPRRTLTNDKSSHGLWPGELKRGKGTSEEGFKLGLFWELEKMATF